MVPIHPDRPKTDAAMPGCGAQRLAARAPRWPILFGAAAFAFSIAGECLADAAVFGSFRRIENAQRELERLTNQLALPARVVAAETADGRFYRIISAVSGNEAAARAWVERAKRKGVHDAWYWADAPAAVEPAPEEAATAAAWNAFHELSGSLSVERRRYPNSAAHSGQRSHAGGFVAEPELHLGVDRVFWGVAESHNSTSSTRSTSSNIRTTRCGSDSPWLMSLGRAIGLGRAGVVRHDLSSGLTHSGRRARLRSPVVMDDDYATYESGAGK